MERDMWYNEIIKKYNLNDKDLSESRKDEICECLEVASAMMDVIQVLSKRRLKIKYEIDLKDNLSSIIRMYEKDKEIDNQSACMDNARGVFHECLHIMERQGLA